MTDLPHEAIADFVRDSLSRHDSYTSYHDRDYHHNLEYGQPFFKEMKETMAEATQEFYIHSGRKGLAVKPADVKVWYSEYKEGDSHTTHCHPNSTAAGTYWPYSDENSSAIKFHNPNRIPVMMLPCQGTLSSEIGYEKTPKTGEMSVWPSWLEHEVKRQGKVEDPDCTRIAISWNVKL